MYIEAYNEERPTTIWPNQELAPNQSYTSARSDIIAVVEASIWVAPPPPENFLNSLGFDRFGGLKKLYVIRGGRSSCLVHCSGPIGLNLENFEIFTGGLSHTIKTISIFDSSIWAQNVGCICHTSAEEKKNFLPLSP